MFAGGQGEGAASGEQLSGTIRVAGSSTVFPVTAAVAEEFAKMYPDVEVPIQSTGTGGGFGNFFIPGKTDINNASRPIKDSEKQSAMDNGIEPIEFIVATDAITVVVNPDAEWINDITVDELAMIWRPENPAQTWSDVRSDWPDEEIELYGPTSASGTFDYFTDEIVGEEGASRSDYQGTEQDNTIVQAVAGSEYAMGYFGMAYYLENEGKVDAVAIEGVKPSLETAKSGQYTPLSRPLFIYVSKESLKRPEVAAFVEFYLEQIDTGMISQIGYVPMTEDEADAQRQKLQDVLSSLE
jgi:phosphate transport system substrate-binding protein